MTWRVGLEDWPVPFVGVPFAPEQSALVIVDVQRYWTDPDGPLGTVLRDTRPHVHDAFYTRLQRDMLPALSRVVATYRERGLPVVHVTSGAARRDGRDFAPHLRRRIDSPTPVSGNFGALHVGSPWHRADVAPQPDELVVNKTTRSAFNSTGLDQLLRHMGTAQLVCTGLVTNGCVLLTALHASDLGYEAFVVSDACASFTAAAHDEALRTIHNVFGQVLTADEICAA